ncbi:hypothetical protein GCM10023238_21070 [Streptomyces heliomycini]
MEGTGPRRWVIDPIDGTKNYVRGVPVWATLISLMEAGEGRLPAGRRGGLRPRLGRRWWAARGHGAYSGRSLSSASRLHVSRVSELSDASFAYSSLSGWEEQGRLDGFLDLTREVWRTRAYGDFWPYMMVAEGSVDLCAEPELSLWDMAATAIVVTEAGGSFTGLDGRPGPHSGNAARVERAAARRAAGVPQPALLSGAGRACAPPIGRTRPLVGPRSACHSESSPTCELVKSRTSGLPRP